MQPSGELTRAITHEPDDSWPTKISIIAYFGEGKGAKRRVLEISADQFFGRGYHGAPLTGDQLIGMVEKLRKMGPKS